MPLDVARKEKTHFPGDFSFIDISKNDPKELAWLFIKKYGEQKSLI